MSLEYIQEVEVEKFNPYHDRRGRFTTAGNAASFTIRTKGGAYQRNLTSRAIEREKKRMNTPVMTEQEFLVSRGVGDPLTDWINDKTVIPRGLTARQQKVHDENGRKEAEKLYNARQAARKEYKEKVKNGELRDKSQMQQTVERAIYGHEDLAATHAARRMLEKRYGLDWKKLKAQAEKESSTKKSVFDGEYIDEPASFDILKSDDDKHLVFGWASIIQTADGETVEDIQKDIIEPEDLEDAAYEYVLNFRDTGEEHLAGYRKKGKLIESCVFTEEKQRAMGLAPGSLPVGWWIGFHIEDEDAWRRIKDGTYRMFSIEGKAERVPVEKKAPTGCGVIVLNDDGEVLTGKRTKENVIGGPGGHIEEGETPEEAAIRETYEEFGIVCRDLQSLGVLDGGEKYGDSAIFLCENYSGRVKTDPKEMTEPQWLSIEDLEDKYLFLPFAQSIDLYRESNVEKFNPYHDDRGRFTHAGGAGSVTYKPGKSKAHDNALERERIKENFYYGKTRNEVLRSLNDIKGVVGELSYEAPKGIDHKTWQARADAYFSRAKEAETMLAYMDKYGVNNAATGRPKLNPNFKEPAKEPAKPKDNRPKSAFDLEWERKEAETLQQVENMMNEYKPKAKPKPKHEQMGLFGDIGKSIGNYDTIVEIEKFNPYHDSLGRFTTASGAKSFTIRTRGGAYQQNLTNRAIEREKKRTANNGFKSKITGTSHNMPKLDNKYAEEDRLKALDRLEKQFARNYKKPNKEKFDEKMKEYLAETDAKEWDMRANGPMMEVLPRFLKAVSPEKRKKRQEEIKAKLAIDEKTRKERSNKLRAHTRAAQQGTENHRKWLEYDMYLRDKYTDKNNPLDGGRMYQQRATKEELAKLDKLYDAIVTQDKSGRWRVAKSDGEFWDEEEFIIEIDSRVNKSSPFDLIEDVCKFNEWHDPKTGRFTNKPGGIGNSTRSYGKTDLKDAVEENERASASGSKFRNSLHGHVDKNGRLTPEREAVHKKIIDDILAGKEPVKGQATMTMLGGGPASGKSSVMSADTSKDKHAITVDPDYIKTKLPGYKELSKKSSDAANIFHEESSALAKRLASVAYNENFNVIYDGTGDGSNNSVRKKIKAARERGYAVNAVYVSVDTETAVARNKKRYEDAVAKGENPRLVPEDTVRNIHRNCTDISVSMAPEFDHIEIWDNNGARGQQKLIAEGGSGKGLVAKDKEKFDNYLSKGNQGKDGFTTLPDGQVIPVSD